MPETQDDRSIERGNMNQKHAKEVARALTLLGCEEVTVLNPAAHAYHVAGVHSVKGQLYVTEQYDATKLILELARLRES